MPSLLFFIAACCFSVCPISCFPHNEKLILIESIVIRATVTCVIFTDLFTRVLFSTPLSPFASLSAWRSN
eukprot:m.123575 g.123575  ORF g.123575 m.123575 type:complete len:70 (-) comp14627_c0_seq2:871-1080(-)